MRIRATKNVAKITNVMKLVSSSKLRGVEIMLEKGKAFGVSTSVWGDRSASFAPFGGSVRWRFARVAAHSTCGNRLFCAFALQESIFNAVAVPQAVRKVE